MLSTKRVGLKPVNTANGNARKITPTGHKNTCIHKQQRRSVLGTCTRAGCHVVEQEGSLETRITALQPLDYMQRWNDMALTSVRSKKGKALYPRKLR